MTNTDELQRYASLDNTKLGEACNLLISLQGYEPYLTDAFTEALRTEIKEQLENFQTKARIVEKEEIIKRTYEELEWDRF